MAEQQMRELDTAALRALGHPLRVRIFDILSREGAQTSSSLSEMTGESSGSTSYHLRILARAHLIEEDTTRGNARERWWTLPKGRMLMGSDDTSATPAGLAATQLALTELYRQRGEWFLRTLQERLARPDEQWEAHLTFANLTLTVPQYEKLAERLQAIIDEVAEDTRDQDDADAVRYSIRLDILPSQNPPRARGAR